MALIISTYIFILQLSFFCHSLADTCAVDRVIEITKKIQQQNDSVLEKCEAINNFTYEIPDLRREIKRKLAQHDFEDLLKSNPDIKYAFSININKLSQVTHSLLMSCRKYTQCKDKWTKNNINFRSSYNSGNSKI